MQTHRYQMDVHIFDTDCYGVMWHGAYIKWLEMGRVDFLKAVGIRLEPPGEAGGHVYPVVEQTLKYLAPARVNDTLVVMTSVEVQGHRLFFHQEAHNLTTGKTTLKASTQVLVLDERWRVQRRIPSTLLKAITSEPASSFD